jgi:hypothetical protein
MRSRLENRRLSPSLRAMNRIKIVCCASLLLLAAGCASSSAAAKGAPSSTPAAGAVPADATAAANAKQTKVVCEYVRPSGSNIMVEECREVLINGEDSSKKASENWFRPPAPMQSR